MVSHAWILQCLKIFKVADDIRNMIEKSMTNCKVELTSGEEALVEVKINRGIFQEDNLSPIFFAITLTPLSILLQDMKAGYILGKFRGEINHSFFMVDLELLWQNNART